MRSPSTPLDAQFLVDGALGNSSGLTIMKTRDRASGTSDHQPIQSRLQMERASRGRTANRVQTLTGLAWRSPAVALQPEEARQLRVGGDLRLLLEARIRPRCSSRLLGMFGWSDTDRLNGCTAKRPPRRRRWLPCR